jgi:ribosomal protein L30E
MLLDAKSQNTYRFLATNKLKQIIISTNQNATQKRQLYVMKKLNQKLATENALITQADKGKTIKVKVKQSRYRPGVNQRVPGS